MTTIHDSGEGRERLRVDSYNNGIAYNVTLGGDGSPLRNVFLQGDDAIEFRADWNALERARPDRQTRNIILSLVDPYL